MRKYLTSTMSHSFKYTPMNAFIKEHDIIRFCQSRKESNISWKAWVKDQSIFCMQERRKSIFQSLLQRGVATNAGSSTKSCPKLIDSSDSITLHERMLGKPQIIIGNKTDHTRIGAIIQRHFGRYRRIRFFPINLPDFVSIISFILKELFCKLFNRQRRLCYIVFIQLHT